MMPRARALALTSALLAAAIASAVAGAARAADVADGQPPVNAFQAGAGGSGATPTQKAGADGDWPWDVLGPLIYDKEYPGTLVVENACKTTETVSISAKSYPGLAVPPTVAVPPGKVDVKMILKTPPRPTPPAYLAVPPGTDPGHLLCSNLRVPVIITYGGRQGDPPCLPAKRTVTITAHVHYVAPPPPPPKLKVAGANACTVLWNTGQRPATVPNIDEECTAEIRELAAAFRMRVLESLRRLDPEKWKWLPSVDQIATMTTGELLAMKAKAAELMK
jgi:hypothetical protein